MVAWWSFLVFFKHLQFMNEASEKGVDAVVIFEINFSITIDLMGVSQVL